jgi:DNA-binding NarL/FixJ family response regulator
VIATGDALLAPTVARRLVSEFAQAGYPERSALGALTPRETQVLRLIGSS